MKQSTTAGLRRLRWWLTVVLTTLNAAGVVVFATVAITGDTRRTDEQLDSRLDRVTSVVLRLIKFDDTLITAFVGEDEVDGQCPQFAILPGGTGQFAGYFSHSCVPLDAQELDQLAAEGVRTGKTLTGNIRATDGQLVRIQVQPFRNPHGQYIGAVVAAAATAPARAAHEQLVLLILGGCVLQIALVALACHVLAGRVIRPGVAALDQQEALLADTAHDLRTPVAALRALAETALDDSEQRTELLSRTVRLAGRMGTIIDALLVRARLAAGVEQLAIQPVRLDQLVSVVVEQTPTDGAQVTVTTAPTTVRADPGLVQRAVGNLLDNALRHGRQPGAPAIIHITVAGGRVVVADHGPGIDASMAAESFDRFGSGSGAGGLGLAIVRWVAQAHGGSLRLYQAEEGGAIFELVLPTTDV